MLAMAYSDQTPRQVLQKVSLAVMAMVLLLLSLAAHVSSDCNVCDGTGSFACVSDHQFAFCADGRPMTGVAPVDCPSGLICSTVGGGFPCQVNETTTVIACQLCNTCNVNNTFACTGPGTFALCLGTSEPSSIYTGTCQPDLVCSSESPQMCINDTDPNSPFAATCPIADDLATVAPTTTPDPTDPTVTTTDPTTVTTPSPDEPEAYCSVIQMDGRFPVGSDPSTTCKRYVRCFQYAGVWRGAMYLCPGSTYFESATQQCQLELPARCSSRVQSLSFLSVVLD